MRHSLMILSLVAVMAIAAGFGFAGSIAGMRISVPFDFYAGDQQLPAGEYTFSMESGLVATGSKVVVQSPNGKGLFFLMTRPGTDKTASRLLFNKYDNRHFLSSISIQGFKASVRITKLEKELRAQLPNSKNVILVAQNR